MMKLCILLSLCTLVYGQTTEVTLTSVVPVAPAGQRVGETGDLTITVTMGDAAADCAIADGTEEDILDLWIPSGMFTPVTVKSVATQVNAQIRNLTTTIASPDTNGKIKVRMANSSNGPIFAVPSGATVVVTAIITGVFNSEACLSDLTKPNNIGMSYKQGDAATRCYTAADDGSQLPAGGQKTPATHPPLAAITCNGAVPGSGTGAFSNVVAYANHNHLYQVVAAGTKSLQIKFNPITTGSGNSLAGYIRPKDLKVHVNSISACPTVSLQQSSSTDELAPHSAITCAYANGGASISFTNTTVLKTEVTIQLHNFVFSACNVEVAIVDNRTNGHVAALRPSIDACGAGTSNGVTPSNINLNIDCSNSGGR